MTMTEDITAREALAILGLANTSSITHLVAEGKLTPSRPRVLPNDAYLFRRGDVEALAASRAASRVADDEVAS